MGPSHAPLEKKMPFTSPVSLQKKATERVAQRVVEICALLSSQNERAASGWRAARNYARDPDVFLLGGESHFPPRAQRTKISGDRTCRPFPRYADTPTREGYFTDSVILAAFWLPYWSLSIASGEIPSGPNPRGHIRCIAHRIVRPAKWRTELGALLH
jgi:hypothetical protein